MRLRTLLLTASVAVATAALPPASHAAPEDSWNESVEPDFDFSFHIGYFEPDGDSELWKANERAFTQDTSDYGSVVFGGAFASHLSRHWDFQVTGEYYDTWDFESAYQDFSFTNGDEIEHDTRFIEAPLDFSMKLLPFGRADFRGSKRIKVLRPIIPYLGGGGGAVYWDYREQGDFVDASNPLDPVLFHGDFHGRGVAWSWHALAGIEVQFNQPFAMFFEGRYRWASDSLGSDFPGFDDFDLSGGSIRMGFSFRP